MIESGDKELLLSLQKEVQELKFLTGGVSQVIDNQIEQKFGDLGNLIKNSISDNLKSLYPVGSIYITTSTATTCPLQSLGIGTWSKVGKGRCIQAATDSQNPNANIEAGLPQISGYFWDLASTLTNGLMANSSGVFYKGGRDDSAVRSVKAAYLTDYTNEPDGISFQASRSSSIYGKSTTVQPPAYLVHIWRRTA